MKKFQWNRGGEYNDVEGEKWSHGVLNGGTDEVTYHGASN